MTSLDFQEAFDRMHPVATEAFLQRIGWPTGITKVLGSVWTSQNRFIQFNDHTHEKPLLAHRSTPQGCPFAPAVLCLWLTAGVNYIENSTGPISNRHLTIYVDDRTFTTRTWSQAEYQIRLWKEWSDAVGLKESTAKIQVTAAGKRNVQVLQECCPKEWIQQDVTCLGTTTVTKCRSNSTKEQQRIEDARSRAIILTSARLNWARLLSAWKIFTIPKVAFGWIPRPPTIKDANSFFNMLSAGLRTGRSASPFLRKILYGATTDWMCIHVTRAWARRKKTVAAGKPPNWPPKVHSGLYMLQKSLQKQGWILSAPWMWRRNDNWY